jgi:tRNA pseudouridine32 synthase / 23S rRNA pseudouridine746 synthase
MHLQENCFTLFTESIESYDLPEKFTFPFYYEPHPLCLVAAKQLQQHLETQTQWQHNFGLADNKKTAIGKMFGVLLVQKNNGEIGYLAAFSGKLADKNLLPKFVPPVFDMLSEDGFFLSEQLVINDINKQIKTLEQNPKISGLKLALNIEKTAADIEIQNHRQKMIAGRRERKSQRSSAETNLSPTAFLELKEQLSKESIKHKNQLRDLNIYWAEQIDKAAVPLNQLIDELSNLKDKRKTLSAKLQKKLFSHYRFLNINGAEKNLNDIFENAVNPIPPAGSGECAAPKLLHYAFKTGLKPLALAEFWWGTSPKSEIRQHRNFYAACQSKCQPILSHMLEGMEIDENPLLTNPGIGKSIDIIYQDDVMAVINKPADLLSVPGKNIEDSVYLRMKQQFPQATGPLIVHRLDMSTSGLMVIALTKQANKNLQQQFIKRTVKKRYVALLSGVLEQDEGNISLPIRVDLDDRPRQLVCYQYGKPAETQWQVIDRTSSNTKVYFYPKTGRTHQLRVHSAHSSGLNMPIVGDDLYGIKTDRLHLHAELLTINHPDTKESMTFQTEAEF